MDLKTLEIVSDFDFTKFHNFVWTYKLLADFFVREKRFVEYCTLLKSQADFTVLFNQPGQIAGYRRLDVIKHYTNHILYSLPFIDDVQVVSELTEFVTMLDDREEDFELALKGMIYFVVVEFQDRTADTWAYAIKRFKFDRLKRSFQRFPVYLLYQQKQLISFLNEVVRAVEDNSSPESLKLQALLTQKVSSKSSVKEVQYYTNQFIDMFEYCQRKPNVVKVLLAVHHHYLTTGTLVDSLAKLPASYGVDFIDPITGLDYVYVKNMDPLYIRVKSLPNNGIDDGNYIPPEVGKITRFPGSGRTIYAGIDYCYKSFLASIYLEDNPRRLNLTMLATLDDNVQLELLYKELFDVFRAGDLNVDTVMYIHELMAVLKKINSNNYKKLIDALIEEKCFPAFETVFDALKKDLVKLDLINNLLFSSYPLGKKKMRARTVQQGITARDKVLSENTGIERYFEEAVTVDRGKYKAYWKGHLEKRTIEEVQALSKKVFPEKAKSTKTKMKKKRRK